MSTFFSSFSYNKCHKATGGYRISSFKQEQHLKWLKRIDPSKIFTENPDRAQNWSQIIRRFLQIYEEITNREPSDVIIREAVEQFRIVLMKEFKPSEVTPYIHILMYHVPAITHRFGNMKKYSCSSLERRNQLHGAMYFSVVQRSVHQLKGLLIVELVLNGLKVNFFFVSFESLDE